MKGQLTGGYSGDKVEILTAHSQCYINKVFSSKSRGLICAEKQASFQGITNSLISLKAVPILSTTLSDNLFCVKMPFISGLSGIDLMTCGSINMAKEISTLTNMYFARLSADFHMQDLDRDILKAKIFDICEKSPPKFKPLIDKFLGIVRNLPHEICYPHSLCHGDFTLSNMLACGDTIFLIDFTPSTFDSLISDIVKIEQDLIFGWSSRYCDKYIKADAKIFSRHAYPRLARDLALRFKHAYFIILVLNWLRIIPYIDDDCTDNLVNDTIVKLISQ